MQYRTIPEFPDYEAGADGSIRRCVAARTSRAGKVLKPWPGSHDERLRVGLRRDGRTHKRLVGRLVCSAFHGPAPEGAETNHLNRIGTDNRAVNLEWVTPSQNVQHMLATGRRGNGRGWTYTPPEAVRAIRASAESAYLLAEQYGIDRRTVQRIRKRETWAHV